MKKAKPLLLRKKNVKNHEENEEGTKWYLGEIQTERNGVCIISFDGLMNHRILKCLKTKYLQRTLTLVN